MFACRCRATAGSTAGLLRMVSEVDCRFDIDRGSVPHIIRVVGRFTGAHVPDLLALWEELRQDDLDATVQIDLSELLSTDTIGFDGLRRVVNDGAVLINVPPYILMKLDPTASLGFR
jgi:hypothetical protein